MLDRSRFWVVFFILAVLAMPQKVAAQGKLVDLNPAQTLLDGVGGTQGLERVWSVVVAPNGSDVYSAASRDDSIVHWRLDSEGDLNPVKIYRGGFDGLDDLDGVFELVLAPDGLHLYGMSDDAVLVFRRQEASGALDLVQSLHDGENGVLGLAFLGDLAISPDGGHLFVARGDRFGHVVQLARNPTTGRLTFERLYEEFPDAPPDAIRPFQIVTDLDFSPDGRHLYVTSLIRGIIVLAVAAGSGELSVVERLGIENLIRLPGALVVSPDGKHVYGTSFDGQLEPDARGLWTLSRNADTGALTLVGGCCAEALPDAPFFGWPELILSADGRDLYATFLQEDTLTHLRRDPESGEVTFAESYRDDPEGEPHFLGPTDVALSPDGSRLFFAASYDDALHSFARSSETGTLSAKRSRRDGEGAEARGFQHLRDGAFSADGRFFYGASLSDDAMTVFSVDSLSGAFTWEQTVGGQRSPGGLGFEGPRQFQISPDGRFLYLIQSPARVKILSIDPTTGHLTLADELTVAVGSTLRKWLMAPDGLRLYAMSARELLTLEVDPSTGGIERIQLIEEVQRPGATFSEPLDPDDIILSPDGKFLYVREGGQGIRLFEIDAGNGGRLVFRDQFVELAGGEVNLRFVYQLEISPDGRNLYGMRSISGTDDLVVLELNPTNGSLSFVERQDLVREVATSFVDPQDIALSPDGLRLVVTEAQTDALVTFAREPATGKLTHLREQRNEAGELDGFLNPSVAVVSPDGESLVVSTDAGLQTFGKGPAECPADGEGLCLQEDRFAVTVDWERSNGATGIGQSVPFGSDDSGLLWFFSENNWEMLVKVLDGCANNGHYWVFSAATTNVEYTLNVADRLTGLRRSYTNPQGTAAAALTDTRAFATCPTPAIGSEPATAVAAPVPSIFPLPEPRYLTSAFGGGSAGGCVADEVSLCLNQSRFKVEVAWERSNGVTGVGHAVPFGSDDSGLLWFFNDANWEMLIKVLDGCTNNGHYWVFSAATTNVEYTLRVTDTTTGLMKEYFNPQGNRAAAITDTRAFETCL